MEAQTKQTFEKIYQGEADAVFRFCLVRVSNREQALDLTQETFLRLWQSLQEDKVIRNEKAFLFTVAHRLVIDWYRKKKSISLESLTQNEESSYDPADEGSRKNLDYGPEGRFLIEKIDELSPTYRDPLYLYFIEDMSPGEIGNILGITKNAASVRINRGVMELRKKTGYDK